jgi:hypothetical protein
MKPKYFIVCTLEKLSELTNCENPLDHAYHNEFAIFDKSYVEYDQLCIDRELFHYRDQTHREARRRTMRMKRIKEQVCGHSIEDLSLMTLPKSW